MVSEPIAVRPTKRCLGDLEVDLPDLGIRLEEIDHPIVVNAQNLPERRDAGGAERVVALADRVWFKVSQFVAEAVVECRERLESERLMAAAKRARAEELLTTAELIEWGAVREADPA